jgi:hypothetical protein
MATIKVSELKALQSKYQEALKDLESLMARLDQKPQVASEVKKPTTKVVAKKVSPTAKAVKPTTKVVAKTNKLTTKVVKEQKGWVKFDYSNLPKEFTFLKVHFQDGSKSLFGRFRYTSLYKGNKFLVITSNDKKLHEIPVDNVKSVYEYHK